MCHEVLYSVKTVLCDEDGWAQALFTQREACDLPGTLLDIYQFVPAQREQDSLRFIWLSHIRSTLKIKQTSHTLKTYKKFDTKP